MAENSTIEQLQAELADARAKLAEFDALLELDWAASMRAITRWRAANPGKNRVLPDKVNLEVWLIERLEEAETDLEAERKYNRLQTEALERPLDNFEIVNMGRAILRHINSEQTVFIGAIAFDAAVAMKRIVTSRVKVGTAPNATGGN